VSDLPASPLPRGSAPKTIGWGYSEQRNCLADVIALNQQDQLSTLYAAHTTPCSFGFGLHAEDWYVMPMIGERRYLAVDSGPIYDDHGELVAIVETLREMTNQKLAKLALHNPAAFDGLTGIVQNGDIANLSTQFFGVITNGSQRLGIGLKQDVVDHRLVLIRDGANILGHGKDHMEIFHWQESD